LPSVLSTFLLRSNYEIQTKASILLLDLTKTSTNIKCSVASDDIIRSKRYLLDLIFSLSRSSRKALSRNLKILKNLCQSSQSLELIDINCGTKVLVSLFHQYGDLQNVFHGD
jgi:hypothetical protein